MVANEEGVWLLRYIFTNSNAMAYTLFLRNGGAIHLECAVDEQGVIQSYNGRLMAVIASSYFDNANTIPDDHKDDTT